jgi:hypothetical protein
MLLAGSDLMVIQVKFGPIAPRELHDILSSQAALENRSFYMSRKWKALGSNPAEQKTGV